MALRELCEAAACSPHDEEQKKRTLSGGVRWFSHCREGDTNPRKPMTRAPETLEVSWQVLPFPVFMSMFPSNRPHLDLVS